MSWKPFFARTFGRRDAPLHFAAHNHHPWPDVTYDAQINYWRDTARLLDDKWDRVLNEIRPRAQRRLMAMLNLSSPGTIAFASNLHEFLLRVLSCLPAQRTPRILTSDSESRSFARQIARLEEDGLVEVERIAAEPLDSFPERFTAAAAKGGHDLVWLSHVFSDSGFVVPALEDIVSAVPDPDTLIVFNGNHAFMAVPVDLRPIEERAFYLAGGYKYAMAGEGVCFLHAPPGYGMRPRDTGWFAGSHMPSTGDRRIPYPEDARRFEGGTFEPSALYRLTSVLEWFAERRLTVDRMTDYVRHLQILFLDHLRGDPLSVVHTDELLVDPRFGHCGRFLVFRTALAGEIRNGLYRVGVIVDHRRDRLRIGFGIYHTAQDVDRLVSQMRLASRYLP